MDDDGQIDNEFVHDGIYCLGRAATALSERMDRDAFYDAAIYYVFGVEKLCRAIVHDVNPVFLLENAGFDNAICAIHQDRLTERARKKVDSDVKRSFIPFQPTMIRAAKFSEAVEANMGSFTELANIRGALAHRSISELNFERSSEFLLRMFVPTVELFAEAIVFEVMECFETEAQYAALKKSAIIYWHRKTTANSSRTPWRGIWLSGTPGKATRRRYRKLFATRRHT